MTVLLLSLLAVILLGLAAEKRRAVRDRKKLTHIVHVNGIRGKSTVTRLIAAGLQAGGWNVFCKTTGTVPMTIAPDGTERPIRRPGRSNIKEQLSILHQAAQSGAEVLVIECMAVDPALQAVTQRQMLKADVGVITNVRLDHTAEMGETLEEICDSLSNTIPRDGVLFTADGIFFSRLRSNAQELNCRAELAEPDGTEPEFDFPENIALAAAVCRELGVERKTALEGMSHYKRDPYAMSVFRLPGGGIFINGMSINDPQSTQLVYQRLEEKYAWQGHRLVLLINNRPDRGYRTQHMLQVALALEPAEVWLMGASQLTMARGLGRGLPRARVRRFRRAEELPLLEEKEGTVIYGVGNIAGPGHRIMEIVREEGTQDVP